MKPWNPLAIGIASAIFGSTLLSAEETAADIAGLQKTAAAFVTAYNAHDSAALAALFTPDGELTDIHAARLISGRDRIEARYREIFAENPLHIAIEVGSVRFVTPGVAIEDGVFHLTPVDDESVPPLSTAFTAILVRDENAGDWRIASSRTLGDVTDAAGHLNALADLLMGEWTCRTPEGVRLDLAIGWGDGGKFLIGEMLTTTADAVPQKGDIRISWDAAKKHIVTWMFDASGGHTQSVWTHSDEGWMIRTEGTTSDGESFSAIQQLTSQGPDTLVWAATRRIIDGEVAPDKTLRLVRHAPEPGQ